MKLTKMDYTCVVAFAYGAVHVKLAKFDNSKSYMPVDSHRWIHASTIVCQQCAI